MQHDLPPASNRTNRAEVSDDELLRVIADFLDMGHVENIVAMFKQEPRYYQWTGRLLQDERFAVRLGVSVLFEYLVEVRPHQVNLAVPALAEALKSDLARVRGEAVSVLGIIGTPEALAHVRTMADDPDPQVREVALDILAAQG
ncbi:MAG TPA: HEAT repeat domain-containing protein [Desulfobulbus sp.]|nr:HEAT repeat domain-containing protein [Desulfobulbus sp.]